MSVAFSLQLFKIGFQIQLLGLSRWSETWLPDGYSQIFGLCAFGPSCFWTMALLRYAAKFDPFLSLVGGRGRVLTSSHPGLKGVHERAACLHRLVGAFDIGSRNQNQIRHPPTIQKDR